MTVPVLLLDVDGVLNALPHDLDELVSWDDWQQGHATASGRRWPILWSPTVVRCLRTWHEQGLLELQWLTTWGHEANDELRQLLGLPELEVAGTHDPDDPGHTRAREGATLADHTPSAPDPLTGRWWKYDVVQRVLRDHPGRTVLWVDDELHRPTAFRDWADAQPHLVALGPHPSQGLTEQDLDRLSGHLGFPAAPPACPTCAAAMVPIVYGMPGVDLLHAAERGELVLGGCVVSYADPAFSCLACDGPDV